MRKSLIPVFVVALYALGPQSGSAQTMEGRAGGPAASCLPEIAKAEQRYHLPAGLLLAMSLAESGRRDPASGAVVPWPWTIQTHGTSQFYEYPGDAIKDTTKYLAQGNALVDVGCLQIDLFHHPDAFKTLEAAFDPETNVDYGAAYLVHLARSLGSWTSAIAAYNAGDPAEGVGYLAKVLYLWKGVHLNEVQISAAGASRIGFVVEDAPETFDIAKQFFEKKDYVSALAIYDQALVVRRDNVTALLGAAECLQASNRTDEARRRFEQALRVFADNRLVLDGLLRLIDGLPADQQLAHLRTAREIVPAAPQLLSRIAMAEARTGDVVNAAKTMGEAVQLAPDDVLLRLDHALMLDRAGARLAALRAYAYFLDAYRPGESPALSVPLSTVRARYAFLQVQNN
jgi:tetratricopeptide (TPR) repeat protein